MDESLTHFGEALDRVNRAVNYLTKMFLCRYNLSMPRFMVLLHLHAKKELNMCQLQGYLLVSPATLTGLVDSLAADGLVDRLREGKDRRMVHLRLTRTGEDVCREVLDFRRRCLEEAFTGTAAELKQIITLLDNIHSGIKEQITRALDSGGRLKGGALEGYED